MAKQATYKFYLSENHYGQWTCYVSEQHREDIVAYGIELTREAAKRWGERCIKHLRLNKPAPKDAFGRGEV
jgi:hypothetical protein